jgi:hypothetical protein
MGRYNLAASRRLSIVPFRVKSLDGGVIRTVVYLGSKYELHLDTCVSTALSEPLGNVSCLLRLLCAGYRVISAFLGFPVVLTSLWNVGVCQQALNVYRKADSAHGETLFE